MRSLNYKEDDPIGESDPIVIKKRGSAGVALDAFWQTTEIWISSSIHTSIIPGILLFAKPWIHTEEHAGLPGMPPY